MKCERCDYITNIRSSLDCHVKSCSVSEDIQTCFHCGYKSGTHLGQHYKISHPHLLKTDNFEKLKCSSCDYSCSIKGSLKRHIRSVHEKKKPHKCSLCHYSCSNKGSLKRHIESVHEKKKPHKCSLCDYSCSQKAHLKRHIESVHEKKKVHKCSLCNFY